MAKSRLVRHPLLSYRRSRLIFILFTVISAVAGVLVWYLFENALRQAGLSSADGSLKRTWILTVLLSIHFRAGLIIGTAVVAAGLTAQFVVGPIERIEQWLLDLEAGTFSGDLQIRLGDKFSKLVDLIIRLAKPD